MKISRNLLRQFCEIDVSDNELIQLISSRIAEIDSVTYLGPKYKSLVLAKVISRQDHPDAEKLAVYKVRVGRTVRQVVAGDKTLQAGDKVAYLPPGSTVPRSFGHARPQKIEQVKLRGKVSEGMMASAAELDFSDDHSRILRIVSKKAAGTPIADIFDLDDVIFDLETKTLTHRPDCFGHIGFAREVAAVQGKDFSTPKWFEAGSGHREKASSLRLSLRNTIPDVAGVITVRAYENVTIGDSPADIQSYLSRLGIRAINNIVDATNYLMILTGQPSHAFDYDKVAALSKGAGAQIIVRYPRKGERLQLLDGHVITPHETAILICSDRVPLALGGVMGGRDSEVDETTTRVIVEVANFDLYSIRRTSMKHGLFTEAITRFARGQDPMQCLPVQDQAAKLLQEWTGASIASPLLAEISQKAKRRRRAMRVSPDFINHRLGTEYSPLQMKKALKPLGFQPMSEGSQLQLSIPTWRADISIAEDIVEEVGRLQGYDAIAPTIPKRSITPVRANQLDVITKLMRDKLYATGGNEIMTYNFVDGELVEKLQLPAEQMYHIRNSISPKLQYMRNFALLSALERVYPNIRLGYEEFLLFEVGKSHSKLHVTEKLPAEQISLAAVYAATDKAARDGAAFYQAKHFLQLALQSGHCIDLVYDNIDTLKATHWLSPLGHLLQTGRCAVLRAEKQTLGLLGEFKPEIAARLKLPAKLAVWEIDLRALQKLWQPLAEYRPLSRYPSTVQDITLQLPDNVTVAKLSQAIEALLSASRLRYHVKIISIFRPSKHTGQRNVTYRLQLSSYQRTLKTSQVNTLLDKITTTTARSMRTKRV